MSWSIIIVAKGLWPVTVQCLESLHYTLPDDQQYELLYVDNGSPAGESGGERFQRWMSDHAAKFTGKSIVIPPHKKEFYNCPPFDYGVGLSTAWNLAIDNSHGDNLVVVNNDLTFVGQEWLQAFEGKLRDPQVGIVGVRNMSWHNVAFNQGSLFAMRHDTFRKIGPFDERLEFSCEEVDYHYRLLKAGYQNPTCEWLATRTQHVDGVTRRHYRDAEWYMMYLAHESRLLFCYKWPELGQPSIYD